MLYNGIKFQKLSFLDQYFDDAIDGIPQTSGMYYWVYYPEYDPISINADELRTNLLEYISKSLLFAEDIKGKFKFEATIREQGYPNNGELFGLSPSKSAKLYSFFSDQVNREFFAIYFKELCFSRPFYVGKANNLRTRLVTQHFKGLTEIIPEIERNKISRVDIWVGYKEIPDPNNDDLNNIFEEIFSRKIKPGLTKKPN